jgi:hypothetical protein
MANARKLGFTPTRVSGGGTVTFRKARVLTNNTLAINFGDAVKSAATGDIVACASGTDEQLLLASVAQGATYVRADGARIEAKGLPAATLYTSTGAWPDNASYVYVVDNATMVEFEANVANSAIALTDLNLNYPIVLTASTTLFSKHELNATGRAVTSTFPFRVREFVQRPDNDISLVDCKVLCMINAGQTEPVTSIYTGT